MICYAFNLQQQNLEGAQSKKSIITNSSQDLKFCGIQSLGDSLLLGMIRSSVQDPRGLITVVLHSNGYPLVIDDHRGKLVAAQLNAKCQTMGYLYICRRKFLKFMIKLNLSCSLQIFKQFCSSRLTSISQQIITILNYHGFTNKTNSINVKNRSFLHKQKLRAKYVCLQSQEQLSLLLSKCDNRRKQLKQKAKKLGNANMDICGMLAEDNYQIQSPEIRLIKQSKQIIEQNENNRKNIEASFKFDLSMNRYLVHSRNQSRPQNILFVKKSVKQKQIKQIQIQAYHKLQAEISVVNSIKFRDQYFPKYYTQKDQNKRSELYVQYFGSSLSFFMANNIFNVGQTLARFEEIVEGVEALHASGVVHRDLKPDNLLICEQSKPHVKIIDFSDSTLVSDKYQPSLLKGLGCTIPYSPFECTFICKQGYNSTTIDIWSLGILLHQFFYFKIPHLYSDNPTSQQFIEEMSSNNLTIYFNKKYNQNSIILHHIESIVQYIIHNCLFLIHYQRPNLHTIKGALKILIKLVNMLKERSMICCMF